MYFIVSILRNYTIYKQTRADVQKTVSCAEVGISKVLETISAIKAPYSTIFTFLLLIEESSGDKL